jgi:hypothetical protein
LLPKEITLRRNTRRLGTLAAVVSAATALVATAGATPAQAADDKVSTQSLRAEHNLGICESQAGDVSLPFSVYRDDRVVVSAGSTIWSGVWGEPRVTPVGKTSRMTIFDNMYADSGYYPLPGARKYGLLLKMDGSYWATGTSYSRFASSSTVQQVSLRINDDVPGNGNGCFSVNVKLYR